MLLIVAGAYAFYLEFQERIVIGDAKILNVDEYITSRIRVYFQFLQLGLFVRHVVCTFKVFKYLQISPSLSVLIITLNEAIDTLFFFLIILLV